MTKRAVFKGPCRARCAHTGKYCALPADGHSVHASGKYRFRVLAAPGQEHFPGADELETAASSRRAVDLG